METEHNITPSPAPTTDVSGKLGDEIEVTELLWRAVVSLLTEGVGDGLMVREDDQVACFQHEAVNASRPPRHPAVHGCRRCISAMSD
jgi:hypothetical protein